MDLFEAIEKRKTIRRFKEGASKDQLRRIIMAGTRAPSAGNRQPWEFIIVDDQKIIDQLAELKYRLNRSITPEAGEEQPGVEKKALEQKRSFENATIVAVCSQAVMEKTREKEIKLSHNKVSVWLCIENMSLAAVGLGLGSGIVSYWGEQKEEAEKILGMPKGYELISVMKFGVPEKDGSPRRYRQGSSFLHQNRFG